MRWVIGDIHGMRVPLEGLVAAVRSHDAASRLLFVGDYVNRGPESRGVVELLLKLKNASFCRGNHDDVFDHVINNVCYEIHPELPNAGQTFRAFVQFGLEQTLISYGIDKREIDYTLRALTPNTLRKLLEPVPAEHRQFFRKLVPVIEEPEFFVAHARWDTNLVTGTPRFEDILGDDARLRHMILWGRFTTDELLREKVWVRHGFFGHTPVSNYRHGGFTGEYLPIHGPKVTLLDTAVALSQAGRLTAFCVETGGFFQVDRAGTVVHHP